MPKAVKLGSKPGRVGNLKPVRRRAADEAQPRRRINDGGNVAEASVLGGVIVKGIEKRGCILDAQSILQIAAGEEIFRAPGRAAVLDIGIGGSSAAPVGADLPAVVEGRGRDVDNARRAQPVLRRHRAGDQGEAADETRIEELSECAEPIRQKDAVDAIGHIGVLVAHMQAAAGGRVPATPPATAAARP